MNYRNERVETRREILNLLLIILLVCLVACAQQQKPACEYICPANKKPPVDCYCIEDALD